MGSSDQFPLTQAILKCPVCGSALASLPTEVCVRCETPVHVQCARFVGGCARFACEAAATPRKRVVDYLKTMRRVSALRTIGVLGWSLPLLMLLVVPGRNGDLLYYLVLAIACGAVAFGMYLAPIVIDIRALDRGILSEARMVQLLKRYHALTPEIVDLFAPSLDAHPVPFAIAWAKVLIVIGIVLCSTLTAVGLVIGLSFLCVGVGYYLQAWSTKQIQDLDRPAAQLASNWLAELESIKKPTKTDDSRSRQLCG